jgi:hypothetical protein
MSPFRYRDDDSSTGTTVAGVVLGAIAGFAVGMFVAQRVGGFSGLTQRFRQRLENETTGRRYDADEIEEETEDAAELYAGSDDVVEDDLEDEDFNGMDATDDGVPTLEERVLEAFNNDPILAERAVDIGAIGSGIIELAGWVDTDDEAEHAMTIARGVPGVDTVVNRLMVEDEEQQLTSNARRVEEGDPALTESRWEGQQVGTGKRRQGMSDEIDRHADPKTPLEDRWLGEREAVRNAAEDIDEIAAERRGRGGRKRSVRADEAEPQT